MALINACTQWYPEAFRLLYWWHVLHAWQQHLVISQNRPLWEKLKTWVRIEDSSKFDTLWVEIQSTTFLPCLPGRILDAGKICGYVVCSVQTRQNDPGNK